MATPIFLPGIGTVPSNLHLNPDNGSARVVTNDLFHIAERVREISPRLYILELKQDTAEGEKFGLAIMEHTPDRGDYLIFRVPIDQLDSRVLDRLRYIMSVDLHTRLAILDKERDKWEREAEEKEMDRLVEEVAGDMWIAGEQSGMWQRPVSYRPMNRTARRHGRRMT